MTIYKNYFLFDLFADVDSVLMLGLLLLLLLGFLFAELFSYLIKNRKRFKNTFRFFPTNSLSIYFDR